MFINSAGSNFVDSKPKSSILKMIRYFSRLFSIPENGTLFRQNIILIGPSGVGKTVTSKRFGLEIENIAENRISSYKLIYRHLNCRQSRTVYLLIVDLLRSLIPNFPKRGLSIGELMRELLTILENNQLYLVLTLDEIDSLAEDNEINNLLYAFTRTNDDDTNNCNTRISLIVISQTDNFLRVLDPSTKSTLSKNIILFNSYTKNQLFDILKMKIKLYFHENLINNNQIELIADIVQEEGGNLRIGLDLLSKLIESCEKIDDYQITSIQINNLRKELSPIKREVLKDLTLPQKVALLSIAKLEKEIGNNNQITLLMVKRQYHIESNYFKLKIGQGHTSLWSYIKKLDEYAIIKTQVVNYGTKGRTTKISLLIPTEKIIQDMQAYIRKELSK
ncbi:MAG: Cdc6/Cdc18 family protein [Candidatus Thorarchaeota archaeon]